MGALRLDELRVHAVHRVHRPVAVHRDVRVHRDGPVLLSRREEPPGSPARHIKARALPAHAPDPRPRRVHRDHRVPAPDRDRRQVHDVRAHCRTDRRFARHPLVRPRDGGEQHHDDGDREDGDSHVPRLHPDRRCVSLVPLTPTSLTPYERLDSRSGRFAFIYYPQIALTFFHLSHEKVYILKRCTFYSSLYASMKKILTSFAIIASMVPASVTFAASPAGIDHVAACTERVNHIPTFFKDLSTRHTNNSARMQAGIDHLTAFITKAKAAGSDTTALEANLVSLQTYQTKIETDHSTLVSQLTTNMSFVCSADSIESWKNARATTKTYFDALKNDIDGVKTLRTEIKTNVQAIIATIKT